MHEKLWKSVNICKSYNNKISGTFFSGHGVYELYFATAAAKQSHTVKYTKYTFAYCRPLIAVAKRPRDASCLSVVSFNSTIPRAHFFIISYFGFGFTSAYNPILFCCLQRNVEPCCHTHDSRSPWLCIARDRAWSSDTTVNKKPAAKCEIQTTVQQLLIARSGIRWFRDFSLPPPAFEAPVRGVSRRSVAVAFGMATRRPH